MRMGPNLNYQSRLIPEDSIDAVLLSFVVTAEYQFLEASSVAQLVSELVGELVLDIIHHVNNIFSP